MFFINLFPMSITWHFHHAYRVSRHRFRRHRTRRSGPLSPRVIQNNTPHRRTRRRPSPRHPTRATTSMFTVSTTASTARATLRAVASGAQSQKVHRVTSPAIARRARVVARAGEDEAGEDEFEAKLGALRGKRSKRAAGSKTTSSEGEPAKTSSAPSRSRAKGVRDFTTTDNIDEPAIDWGVESVVYEGPPARGEVVANVAMSWTLVWIPLAIQAVGRALWLTYKITDKRVTVISVSPLRKERTDIPLDQITDVISIGRGIGAWGDMVVTLRNGEKVEVRSLPDFKKCEEMIRSKMYKEKIIDF